MHFANKNVPLRYVKSVLKSNQDQEKMTMLTKGVKVYRQWGLDR